MLLLLENIEVKQWEIHLASLGKSKWLGIFKEDWDFDREKKKLATKGINQPEL